MQAEFSGTLLIDFVIAATSLCLVAVLLSLAVLEHLFMVMPIPTGWLWKWGMRVRA